MRTLIAAIDQGTTSTRCIVYAQDFRPLGSAQREHRQSTPRPGRVEHDAAEILANTDAVVREALSAVEASPSELAGVGITNQRETFVLWERASGKPCAPAIVWQDTRSKSICERLAREPEAPTWTARTGLPLATYFSGPKLMWLLQERPELRAAAERGELAFGTMETWLLWNLSGGPDGGVHVTDVTNACRTFLVDLERGAWDAELLERFGVPEALLPKIVANAEPGGWATTKTDGPFGGEVALCAAIGDQQAAVVGQRCFEPGDAKNTYGTGCFLLWNTGREVVRSTAGMLSTVAYRFPGEETVYALEGSVAVAGSLIQWLRDRMRLIESAPEVEDLARAVPDTGGVHLVPAFGGLFAPRWRSDARGVIVGLSHHSGREHVARAALEATAFQVAEVIEAMRCDTDAPLASLRVDGGMAANDLLLQIQADLLGVPVERASDLESTALGAATMAAFAQGSCEDRGALRDARDTEARFEPSIDRAEAEERMRHWKRAVERSLDWVEEGAD